MIQIKTFTFNPYQENTYLLYTENGACAIIDPGMYGQEEQQELSAFIAENKLQPRLLLNTHCHIDHVLGNRYIYETYKLMPQFHEKELPVLLEVQNYAPQMGFNYDISPISETFLDDSGQITIDGHSLEILFAPGHSPGHLCFYSPIQDFLIGGDVLFQNSIGRTDLPGGNHEQLLRSIQTQLYSLPEQTIVYPGHGPQTTIGDEKQFNPFVRG